MPTHLRFGSLLNHDVLPSLQWIEAASAFQIPGFHIVGLPSREVGEARERIRAAIDSSGLEFPRRRVTLNLSPASVRKSGTGADLAMALAVLSTATDADPALSRWVACGELGLDGAVKPTGQVLRALYAAWAARVPAVLLPTEELESALCGARDLSRSGDFPWKLPEIYAVSTLSEAWKKVLEGEGPGPIDPVHARTRPETRPPRLLALSPSLERALGVAAAGAHHLLMLGPRGTGKSHALEWLSWLQPPAADSIRVRRSLLQELVTKPSDYAGVEGQSALIRRVGVHVRPAALIGSAGATSLRPGEFALAHGGLLVADELPEWSRDSREALREPMERGLLTLNRAQGAVEFPARFTLAANGNLCPCGGSPPEIPFPIEKAARKKPPRCLCKPMARRQYLNRLSGPILDRIDLVLLVTHAAEQADERGTVERAAELREQVLVTREIALSRWGAPPGQIDAVALEDLLGAHPEWRALPALSNATSLRARHKALRLALTLAIWDGKDTPTSAHFTEAACYRAERFGICG